MTGEMSASEVTRDNYPELFALRDALKRRGIASEPRPFDQYQGPYLAVPGVGAVWYHDVDYGRFAIEYGFRMGNPGTFDVVGDHLVAAYTLRQAARRIAELVS